MFSNARVNHGSMPVTRDSASGVMPLRSAKSKAHSRSSFGWRGRAVSQFSRSWGHLVASHKMERPVISRDRTAFWNAASNDRSIAMTSPVAFICVVTVRSPLGNLSNGQRGILTTQ